MTTTPCRAKNPATCRTHGTQHVTDLYNTWRNGDMDNNKGRFERATAFMTALEAWQCQAPVRTPDRSHDSGAVDLPCHLPKNHPGEHDPKAKEPWA